MATTRYKAIKKLLDSKPQDAEPGLESFQMTSDFGSDVFTMEVMRERLSKHTFGIVSDAISANKHELMEERCADEVAEAMKTWAVEKGATHFTHWFQPLRGMMTAEKHEAFLSFEPSASGGVLARLSGKDLVQGEPDASSFPTGGLRSTFEARGYTVWDPLSPAFIRRHKNGNTLCIPTAFCSWTGVSIDNKTPLLRSEEALSRESLRMLQFFSEDKNVSSVYSNLGVEQEFFLVDRGLFQARPDLAETGRTLIGAAPSHGQELADHYFGSMPPRVMACIQDLEKQLWRLGVPQVTRHNEVAPGQFEMAPIFESASLAVDHNVLEMDLLREAAYTHGLACLLAEKPFAGMNGSAKHCNWSLCTSSGENLLEPGEDPLENLRFMTFMAAVIKALDEHADLIRCSFATPGNDHRLGGHEAPPTIISVFVGEQLTECLSLIMADEDYAVAVAVVGETQESGVDGDGDGGDGSNTSISRTHTQAQGGLKQPTRHPSIRLGVEKLPHLQPDETDRNRTSPFAFTGNKFEFRAVGSDQHCARPAMTINAVVADALRSMSFKISEYIKDGVENLSAIRKVVRDTFIEHNRVIFNGNNYSEEWVKEAVSRGLPNLKGTPAALDTWEKKENMELWGSLRIMSIEEVRARSSVWREDFISKVQIEARSLLNIIDTHVIPAALQNQAQIVNAVCRLADSTATIGVSVPQSQVDHLSSATVQVDDLLKCRKALFEGLNDCDRAVDEKEKEKKEKEKNFIPDDDEIRQCILAHYLQDVIRPLMDKLRVAADIIEVSVGDSMWSLPKYQELCFLH